MRFTTQSLKSPLIRAIVFVVCALPGLYFFLVGSAGLFGALVDGWERSPNPLLSVGKMSGGILFMLLGVDKWGQWRYVLVLLAIPLVLFGSMLVFPTGNKASPGILVGLVAFLTLFLVRRSSRQSEDSRTREREKRQEEPHEMK